MTVLRAIQPHSERPVVQEPEAVASKRAVRVAILFLLVFATATIWSVAIMNQGRDLEPQEVIPSPREIGKPEIGMVNQRLFELQLDGKQQRDEQLRRLNSYGWVDRDKQIIHIPIERAMEVISAEPRR
jgi:hypothetical protein